jgi:hypothetical protein
MATFTFPGKVPGFARSSMPGLRKPAGFQSARWKRSKVRVELMCSLKSCDALPEYFLISLDLFQSSDLFACCYHDALSDGTGGVREDSVGIRTNEPNCAHHDLENDGQHHCVFRNILPVLFVPCLRALRLCIRFQHCANEYSKIDTRKSDGQPTWLRGHKSIRGL